MDVFSIDKYLDLPRRSAFIMYLDEKNLTNLRRFLLFALIFFSIAAPIAVMETGSVEFSLPLYIINVIFLLVLRIRYKKIFNISNVRKYAYYILLSQLFIGILINFTFALTETATETIKQSGEQEQVQDSSTANGESDSSKKSDKIIIQSNKNYQVSLSMDNYDSYSEWILVFGIALLFFRFPKTELIQLALMGFFIPIAAELLTFGGIDLEKYVSALILYPAFVIISYTSEKRQQKKFLEQYNFAYNKHFDSIRMKRELDSAKQIQLSMLPENNAVINGIEISGISFPASEVGGDYFDYFKISETKTGIFICDVSGHGVASALLLSGLRSCMQLILEDYKNPRDVMEKLNRMVRKTQDRKMFVTAIFAVIDTEKNECQLFNAGHLPPYRISGSAGEIFKIKKHGITLGAVQEISIGNNETEVVFDFNKGDKLVFYTDGLSEAMDPAMQEYGFHKIEEVINSNTDKNPKELIKLLLADVKLFTKGKQQLDDLTILIARRN